MKFLDLNGLKRVIDKILLKVQPYIYSILNDGISIRFKNTHQIVTIDTTTASTIDISLWFDSAPLGSMLEFIVVEKLPRCTIFCTNSSGTTSFLTKVQTINSAPRPTNIQSLVMDGNRYVRIMKYSSYQALVITDMNNEE